jgi:hypothetical protein
MFFLLSFKSNMQFYSKNKKASKKHKISWNELQGCSIEKDRATASILTHKHPQKEDFLLSAKKQSRVA